MKLFTLIKEDNALPLMLIRQILGKPIYQVPLSNKRVFFMIEIKEFYSFINEWKKMLSFHPQG